MNNNNTPNLPPIDGQEYLVNKPPVDTAPSVPAANVPPVDNTPSTPQVAPTPSAPAANVPPVDNTSSVSTQSNTNLPPVDSNPSYKRQSGANINNITSTSTGDRYIYSEEKKKKKKGGCLIILIILLLLIGGFVFYEFKFADENLIYKIIGKDSNSNVSNSNKTSKSNSNTVSNSNSNIISNSNSNVVSNTNINVESIKFADENPTIKIGESKKIDVIISPEEATDKSVTFKSSDESIATIDSDGNITAIKEGNVVITATTTDGNYNTTVNLKVLKNEIKVEGLKTSVTSRKIAINGKYYFSTVLTITPRDATNKKINYSSSNTKVATVSSSGKIVGVSVGTARITATTEDGNYSTYMDVTIYKPTETSNKSNSTNNKSNATSNKTVNASSVSISGKNSLSIGSTTKLAATVTPSNATNKTVTWSSNTPKIVSVDSSGNVKCLAKGTGSIKASVGSVSSTYNVKCLTTISVKTTSITKYASMTPNTSSVVFTTTDNSKNVTVTSSNSSIVSTSISSVNDTTGYVLLTSGKQYGKATITLKTSDGATATITVTNNVYEVRTFIGYTSKVGHCFETPYSNYYSVYYNGTEISNWTTINVGNNEYTKSTAHGENIVTQWRGQTVKVTVNGTSYNAIFTKTGGCS